MIDKLFGRLPAGKEVLSPEDNDGGAALAPVTVKGESSGADLSPHPFFSSACPKEDNVSAKEAKRLTARLVFVFILICLFVLFVLFYVFSPFLLLASET